VRGDRQLCLSTDPTSNVLLDEAEADEGTPDENHGTDNGCENRGDLSYGRSSETLNESCGKHNLKFKVILYY